MNQQNHPNSEMTTEWNYVYNVLEEKEGWLEMVNKNYVKGRTFEYKIKKQFEDKGYLVFRTAGSHSVADLIAFPKLGDWFRGKKLGYVPILIQCKATTGKGYSAEVAQLKKEAENFALVAILVTKDRTIQVYNPEERE